MTTTVGLKLDDETRKRLQELGAAKDRSAHWLMKKAISEYLAREEAYESEKREDERRWRNYIDSGEAVAHADMEDWFDGLERRARDAAAE